MFITWRISIQSKHPIKILMTISYCTTRVVSDLHPKRNLAKEVFLPWCHIPHSIQHSHTTNFTTAFLYDDLFEHCWLFQLVEVQWKLVMVQSILILMYKCITFCCFILAHPRNANGSKFVLVSLNPNLLNFCVKMARIHRWHVSVLTKPNIDYYTMSEGSFDSKCICNLYLKCQYCNVSWTYN